MNESTAVGWMSGLGAAGVERYESSDTAVRCVRHGRGWRIEAGRRSAVVRHSVGMFHLAVLIANPGREIPALELVTGLAELAARAARSAGAGQAVLDREAVRSYRDRITALEAEIDVAESCGRADRAAQARTERDWLAAELGRAVGVGGRMRSFPDGAERARIAVGKAIRRALLRIAEADAVIGGQLHQAIHTGARCCYWPL